MQKTQFTAGQAIIKIFKYQHMSFTRTDRQVPTYSTHNSNQIDSIQMRYDKSQTVYSLAISSHKSKSSQYQITCTNYPQPS